MLRISLWGRLRVEAPDGSNLTPRSAKAQGLVALIATADHFERGRLWTQDKLWSDRSPDQGGASLRQALSDIRRTLGDYRDILRADRQSIGFCPDRIWLVPPSDAEFLEGLDVRDPEFNIWLAAERASEAPPEAALPIPSTKSRRTLVRFVVRRGQDPVTDWIAATLSDQTAALVRDVADVLVEITPIETLMAIPREGADFVVEIEIGSFHDADIGMRLALSRGNSAERLWEKSRVFPAAGLQVLEDPNLSAVATMLSEAVQQAVYAAARNGISSERPPFESILRKIFSMMPDEVREADRLLSTSADLKHSVTALAWRAQIRTIQYAERHADDRRGLAEEAREFTSRALEINAFNVNALVAAANAALFLDGDVFRAGELATTAVDIQPLNPFARWSLSAASLYADDLEKAQRNAQLGSHVTRRSRRRFWWDLQEGATALIGGDLEKACRAFAAAHSEQPQFRPPLRYLIALHACQGRLDKAAMAYQKLRNLEPDFTNDRLLKDRSYPASLVQ